MQCTCARVRLLTRRYMHARGANVPPDLKSAEVISIDGETKETRKRQPITDNCHLPIPVKDNPLFLVYIRVYVRVLNVTRCHLIPIVGSRVRIHNYYNTILNSLLHLWTLSQ